MINYEKRNGNQGKEISKELLGMVQANSEACTSDDKNIFFFKDQTLPPKE